jgi:hypothetical protein
MRAPHSQVRRMTIVDEQFEAWHRWNNEREEDREQARLERQSAERSARRAARIAELGLPPEPPIGPVILDGSGANPYQAWSEWFTKVLRAGYDHPR